MEDLVDGDVKSHYIDSLHPTDECASNVVDKLLRQTGGNKLATECASNVVDHTSKTGEKKSCPNKIDRLREMYTDWKRNKKGLETCFAIGTDQDEISGLLFKGLRLHCEAQVKVILRPNATEKSHRKFDWYVTYNGLTSRSTTDFKPNGVLADTNSKPKKTIAKK